MFNVHVMNPEAPTNSVAFMFDEWNKYLQLFDSRVPRAQSCVRPARRQFFCCLFFLHRSIVYCIFIMFRVCVCVCWLIIREE